MILIAQPSVAQPQFVIRWACSLGILMFTALQFAEFRDPLMVVRLGEFVPQTRAM